jgi:hypothetical protein
MINVKLNIRGFGEIETSVEDLEELEKTLNITKKFIDELAADAPVHDTAGRGKTECDVMFTPEELKEASENVIPTVQQEADRVFFNSVPVQIPSSQVVAVPPAPVVAPQPPAGNGSPVELDADGLPWDSRIHSRTRSKTSDGRWKLKRGSDVAVRESVKTELTQVMQIPTPPPAPVAANGAPAGETFITLMPKIAAAVNAGRLTQEQVAQTAQNLGLPSIVMASSRPDLIPALSMALSTLAGGPL